MEREEAAREGNPPPGSKRQDRRRLPPELAALLSGKQEQGLNHVIRRRILRAMHQGAESFSSVGLSREPLGDHSLSTIAYHMKVLRRFGMVEEDSTADRRGAVEHFFASSVSDDPLVISTLAQTEELDAPKRADGGED